MTPGPEQQLVGITVRLTRSERDQLKALAESQQRSLAGEIRKAVVDHLDGHEHGEAA